MGGSSVGSGGSSVGRVGNSVMNREGITGILGNAVFGITMGIEGYAVSGKMVNVGAGGN
jgi:hypothetical protein